MAATYRAAFVSQYFHRNMPSSDLLIYGPSGTEPVPPSKSPSKPSDRRTPTTVGGRSPAVRPVYLKAPPGTLTISPKAWRKVRLNFWLGSKGLSVSVRHSGTSSLRAVQFDPGVTSKSWT